MFNFEQTNVPAVPDTNMRALPQGAGPHARNLPARSRKIYRIDLAMVSLPRRSENPERRNEACLLTKNPSDEHFTMVVMPHLDDAYALARWLSGNSTDAEDIVQEACLRALRGLDRYAGGNARAWLLAITRNAAFTWLARNRSKALVISEDIENLPPRMTRRRRRKP